MAGLFGALLAWQAACLAQGPVGEPQDEAEPAQTASDNGPAASTEDASTAIAENLQDAESMRRFMGERKLVFFGRAEADAAWYEAPALDGDSGLELRRLRVGMAGVNPRWEHISYKVELDLSDGSSSLSSAYLRFDLPQFPGSVTIGNQDVSQNLSAMTGSLSQLFLEAPLPVDAFSLEKRLAVSWDWHGNTSGAHLMAFGKDHRREFGHRGIATRLYWSPVRARTGIWHFGGAFVWEDVDGEVRLRTRPESHVTDVRLVDTGAFDDVTTQQHISLELAGAAGAASGRLEVFETHWEHADGARSRFRGAYWEGGYFLTGQPFAYRQGRFIRPELSTGKAAWELGLRLSWVDLDDGRAQGGEQRNAGLALNWYPRPGLRGMFNLIQVNSDRTGGDGPLAQVRVQYNW